LKLPESTGAGRALFAAAGAAVTSLFLVFHLLGGGWADDLPRILLPALIVAASLAAVRIRYGSRWRWASFLGGALLASMPSIAHTCAPTGLDEVSRWAKTRRFDAATWVDDKRLRVWMVDDFLTRIPVVGWQRAQIEALLGPPDDDDERGVRYDLGNERLQSWDSETLEIDYDPAGRVVAARVSFDEF